MPTGFSWDRDICLQTQFVIRDRAKILYIEFLRRFVWKFVGPKRTKITFFYDTTELVWLNYSRLRWVTTFPRTRSEYTKLFIFARAASHKKTNRVFSSGLVVGLIYSLREDKYSPLAQILKLDVKYHGLFFYSTIVRVSQVHRILRFIWMCLQYDASLFLQ